MRFAPLQPMTVHYIKTQSAVYLKHLFCTFFSIQVQKVTLKQLVSNVNC